LSCMDLAHHEPESVQIINIISIPLHRAVLISGYKGQQQHISSNYW